MTKRVLSVGQCGPDHGSISRFLKSTFDVAIETAATATETFDVLAKQHYDLVLINRKLDEDYSDGDEIIRQMKADANLSAIPVMLITNYPEYQDNAEQLGAVRGFGKNDLGRSDVIARLEPYLG
ncbi:response regulator [bacterium]|nr:response regulator [bacterium]